MAGRPDPKELGAGFATLGAVLVAQKSKAPVLRAVRRLLKVAANSRNLAEYYAEESIRRAARGSRPWMVAGGAVWTVRLLRRARRRQRTERIVLHEVIGPGDRIVISQVPRKAPRRS